MDANYRSYRISSSGVCLFRYLYLIKQSVADYSQYLAGRLVSMATLLVFASLGAVLSGCSGGGSGDSAAPERAAGMLSAAESNSEFAAAIKTGLSNQIQNRPTYFVNASDSVAMEDSLSRDFTRTYTLEANVDEADIIKYNGELLMVAPGRNSCCPVCDCLAPFTTNTQHTAAIGIYRTNPAAATAAPVSRIEFASDLQITGMYVHNTDTLAVLGTSIQYPSFGAAWFSSRAWLNTKTTVSIHDLQNAEQPQLIWQASVDGSLVESRRIGNTLYLISRFTSFIEGLDYFYIDDAERRQANQAIIDASDLQDLIPKIRIGNDERDLVNATACYVPTADGNPGRGYANGSITTITAIPLDNPDNLHSTCYTGNAQGLYMSLHALYLVEQIYSRSDQYEEFTLIHKFALANTRVDYRGSAQLQGVLGHRTNIDFRLNEFDNDLRVITSRYDYGANPLADTEADSVDHHLTILRESASRFALEPIATLPNDTRPEEIGKPDELLYGVRFTDERAYLITFEPVDPLYVLDLSDPAQPTIAGQVEVPGFADFIHPVSDKLLLTLGKDASPSEDGQWTFFDGVKIELFDVSDISIPQSVTRLSIGDRYTDSEALYDRHAFTYIAADTITHRFAIPIDVYQQDDIMGRPIWRNSGLHLFELQGIDSPASVTLRQQGELRTSSVGSGEPPYYYSQRRSVLHDDAVYFINSKGIWSAFWSSPGSLIGPVDADNVPVP